MNNKIKFILAMLLLSILVGCGINDDKAKLNYTIEEIYRQEDYISKYSYGIYDSTREDLKPDIVIFGMDFSVRITDYYTILNADGSVEESICENHGEARQLAYDEVLKKLSQTERGKLEGVGSVYECIELKDAKYVLVAKENEEIDGYMCHLFKSDASGKVVYVNFDVDYLTMSDSEIAILAAYEDETICVCDKIWFDTNLKRVDKAAIEPYYYLLQEENIQATLENSGISELESIAEDFFVWQHGRMGDVNYLFVEADDITYLVELDTQGNILLASRINGLFWARDVVPKIRDEETGKYYDVKH